MSVARTGGRVIYVVPLQSRNRLVTVYVDKLQSKIVILLHEQPHDFLEVVDLIARDPNMIVQNSWLTLTLRPLISLTISRQVSLGYHPLS